MSIQKTSWGQVEWLTAENDAPISEMMSVGLATIYPHVAQERHIHYETEQFIYILQGAGYELINGKKQNFHKGMFYYLPPNITHELINPGDEEVLHLLVSVPTAFHATLEYEGEMELEQFSGSFYAAVEAIRNQLTENCALPVTIFDDMGNLVLQNDKFPEYCRKHCELEKRQGKCECFSGRRKPMAPTSDGGVVCSHGLTVFRIPIKYKKQFLGSLYSGHIFLGGDRQRQDIDMYDTPRGTTLAIQTWMANIAKSLTSFCSFDGLRRSINQRDDLLAQNRQTQQALEADLKAMRSAVTNLKINHHFLFNTLNAIAGQALEGDRMTTYQTIVDLAKMFRYSTSGDLQLVPLRSEIEYLNTYLHMQRLRYGENLTATLEYGDELLSGLVPFNFLQPIVENAFTHGFVDVSGQKILQIRIHCRDNRLVFLVRNNGQTIDKVTLNRVQSSLRSSSGHGMSLVYSKLEAIYGADFSIQIASSAVQGTRIRLEIPFQKHSEGGSI